MNIQHARRRLVEDAIKTHPKVRRRFVAMASIDNWCEPIVEELVPRSTPRWSGEDLRRGTGSLVMGMTPWVCKYRLWWCAHRSVERLLSVDYQSMDVALIVHQGVILWSCLACCPFACLYLPTG